MRHSYLIASLAGCIWLAVTSCFSGPDANNNYLTKKQKEDSKMYVARMDTTANEMLPETLTIQLQNPSDNYFQQAIAAFENGNMQGSAAHLREGLTALRGELLQTRNMTDKRADSVLTRLNNLEGLVRKSEIRNVNDMVSAIWDAEKSAAHNYVFEQGKFYPEDISGHSFKASYIDTLNLLGSQVKTSNQRKLYR